MNKQDSKKSIEIAKRLLRDASKIEDDRRRIDVMVKKFFAIKD